jgi:hypothetical protein
MPQTLGGHPYVLSTNRWGKSETSDGIEARHCELRTRAQSAKKIEPNQQLRNDSCRPTFNSVRNCRIKKGR